jgi:predicted acetyltransferase
MTASGTSSRTYRFRLESPEADHPGRWVVSACFGEDLAAPPGDLVYGVCADGIVVSHLDLYWKTIRVGGRRVEIAAIGQVCTLPEYRGRGLATGLLEAAHEEARLRVPFSALFGSPTFYARVGYRETTSPMSWGSSFARSQTNPTGPSVTSNSTGQRW